MFGKKGDKLIYIGEDHDGIYYGDELTLVEDLSPEMIQDLNAQTMEYIQMMYWAKDSDGNITNPVFEPFNLGDLMLPEEYLKKMRSEKIHKIMNEDK